MTEEELVEKLQKIKRLFSVATTEGERNAAANAISKVRERLKTIEQKELAVEYKFSLADQWSRKLFVALLRRYEIKPYRLRRQRHTTVMAKAPKSFIEETLWPEFQELSGVLSAYIAEITDKVIRNNIHHDSSEASVVEEPRQLEG